MNQINVKEKCWEENTWNKRKGHNNLLKKKITNMKRKITDDIRKEKGHNKLSDIVSTLRGKNKHDTTEETRKNYMISMKLNYQQKNGLSILQLFWGKVYQKHTNTLTEQWDPLKI